jgi:uncharacterized coiled-coil DUF342 family protein
MYAHMSAEEEINVLKDEADAIKNELDSINRRIQELESEGAES